MNGEMNREICETFGKILASDGGGVQCRFWHKEGVTALGDSYPPSLGGGGRPPPYLPMRSRATSGVPKHTPQKVNSSFWRFMLNFLRIFDNFYPKGPKMHCLGGGEFFFGSSCSHFGHTMRKKFIVCVFFY